MIILLVIAAIWLIKNFVPVVKSIGRALYNLIWNVLGALVNYIVVVGIGIGCFWLFFKLFTGV